MSRSDIGPAATRRAFLHRNGGAAPRAGAVLGPATLCIYRRRHSPLCGLSSACAASECLPSASFWETVLPYLATPSFVLTRAFVVQGSVFRTGPDVGGPGYYDELDGPAGLPPPLPPRHSLSWWRSADDDDSEEEEGWGSGGGGGGGGKGGGKGGRRKERMCEWK
eukprot:2863425-Rhodomonas_salina.2